MLRSVCLLKYLISLKQFQFNSLNPSDLTVGNSCTLTIDRLCSTGAAAAWQWSDLEEIPYIQGQRRSPSKMVEGAKSHLE